MQVKNNWTPHEWMMNGSQLIHKDPKLAKKWIKNGLKIVPDDSAAMFNLGLALHQDNKISEAIRAYRYALSDHDLINKAVNKNLAQDLLLSGEFEEGWKLYEQRLDDPKVSFKLYEDRYGKAWEGLNDKRKCKHLIVVSEQGYGDTIQFCRFILVLQELGIKTSLFCQDGLAKLLRNSTQIHDVRTDLIDQIYTDTRWCPLMSLPKHLGIKNDNIPFNAGYIEKNKDQTAKWKYLLQRAKNKKLVAIHWQGNPKFEKSLYSRGRSMKADYWNSLGSQANIEYVSLQKGEARYALEKINNLDFVKGQDEFDKTLNFEDTAAVLANCDLVLSTDSSVVHLAGSMNIPTWVALSWVPEWRWGLNASTTPWYKSVRLYRQPTNGDWLSVIKSISKELQTLK